MRNKIPKKFTKITAIVLFNSDFLKKDDIVEFFIEDGEYKFKNTRTNYVGDIIISSIRNKSMFRILNIE